MPQESDLLAGVLNSAHSGDLNQIRAFHAAHPDIHYTAIRYKTAGDTILHVSARLGHADIVEYLLENYTPHSVDCKSLDHKTALHEAAQFARWQCGRLLVRYGADVNALKKADWTPLMLACTKTRGREEECYKMVELLASEGALVNFKNKDGWTAAHILAREGNIAIFNLLRNQYALNITARTNNGRTIFHIAALHGHIHFLEILNTLGVDPNIPDQCGNTAVHEACLGGHCNVVKLLRSTEIGNVDCRNKEGFNCLHLAAGAGHYDVVRLLLDDFKLDVNVSTKRGGLTPLHLAARKQFGDVYGLLLSYRAREDINDAMGRTPIDYFKMQTGIL